MPRKKQIVQKRKRQKVYTPGAMTGEATHIKRRGVFKLFSNYRLFAIIGAVAIVGGLAFSAVLGSTGGGTSGDTSVRGPGETRDTPEAGETREAAVTYKAYPAPPDLTIDLAKDYTATIKTAKGDIKVELFDDAAPQTVNNFVFLARDHFYDGVTFHRVVQGFVAQAGDPRGTGVGGPGYSLPFEATDEQFTAGVLAMANRNTAGSENHGSQFFFTLEDEPTLEGKHTAFGRVADDASLAVLQSLTVRDPRSADAPAADLIESITIEESPATSAAAP